MNEKLSTRDQKLAASRARRDAARGNGFTDVTCTIGRVHWGPDYQGSETVRQAAFRMIADHHADGEFSFTDENGTTVRVAVENTDHHQEGNHA